MARLWWVLLLALPMVAADIEDGLVARYALDGNANDYTGMNNGTNYGAVQVSPCIVDSCMYFDGSSYINISDNRKLDFNQGDYTVAFWVNRTSTGGFKGVVQKYAGSNVGWLPRINTNGDRYEFKYGNGSTSDGLTMTTPTNASKWYHVIIQHDADGNDEIYINGSLNVSSTATQVNTNSIVNLFIGREGSNYFSGLLDEICIYNRTLTVGEINYLSLGNVCVNITSAPTNTTIQHANQANDQGLTVGFNIVIGALLVGVAMVLLYFAYFYDRKNAGDSNGLVYVKLAGWLTLFLVFGSMLLSGVYYKTGSTETVVGAVTTVEPSYQLYAHSSLAFFYTIMSGIGFVMSFFDLRGVAQ